MQTDSTTPAPVTYLFVPGSRPERFAKALASGADRVIIDLEDAVSPADKSAARSAIQQWWAHAGVDTGKVLVRINDAATPWFLDDLTLIRNLQVPCVMLPKCEAPQHIAQVLGDMPQGTGVLALIETARGMVALNDIAASAGLARLAFGSIDYMADLDLPANSPALDFAAAQIAVASRAAGLPSPVAGVTPDLTEPQVTADTLQARALGFGAKMCIHPSQVSPVFRAMMPSATELAWAQRVLAAWQASAGGALQVDGKMVDRPVVLKAERIAALAARSV